MDGPANWTGLLGKVQNNECDFVFGGYYPDNEVADHFWGSDTYLQDAHTWYIKMADRRPAWQALVGIFEAYTWIGFILILIISWLFWFTLVMILPEPKYYQQLSLTAINALAVTISIAVQERPICETTRLFFMALTLYGLNVVATYTSKMIATFQDPGYLHQLDELTEVVAAGKHHEWDRRQGRADPSGQLCDSGGLGGSIKRANEEKNCRNAILESRSAFSGALS